MKTIVKITALLVIIAGCVLACNDPKPQPKGNENPEDTTKTEDVYYSVTFAGEEISIASQTVESGNHATRPATPERANYDFGGWFTDNGTFTNEWNFETDIVTQDTKLYAKWEQIPPAIYTVIFAGEDISIASQTVKHGNRVPRPANPQRANYNFGGWYTDNGTFANEWNFSLYIVTQDTTLYAKWIEIPSGINNLLIGTWREDRSDSHPLGKILYTFSDNGTIYMSYSYHLNGNDYIEESEWAYQFISEDTIRIERLGETNPSWKETISKIIVYDKDNILIEKFIPTDAGVMPPLVDIKLLRTQ